MSCDFCCVDNRNVIVFIFHTSFFQNRSKTVIVLPFYKE
nr:MAG TPA: hypothetical protein [Caudoviricetes sp.]